MSSYRRQGRFTTTTATEAYQRQLTAPVHKWRRAWVAPQGLQPESSYKVYKWVRVDDKDIEDLLDGDEDEEAPEEDEGEGEGDGDENADADENENENENGGEEAEEEGVKPSGVVPTPAAEGNESESALPTPANEVTPTIQITATSPTKPTSSDAGAGAVAGATVDNTSTTTPSAQTAEPAPEPQNNHTEIPSNAIELTNTAPGGTEVGHGDLGAQAGIEIHKPESVSPVKQDAELDEDKMEVDDDAEGGVGAGADTGMAADEGLVMGEMEPPKGQEGLELVGGDGEPPEVETDEKA